MHDDDCFAAQPVVDHSHLLQRRKRKRLALPCHRQPQDHRLRFQTVVTIDNVRGRGAFTRQALTNLLVLRRDAIGIPGQRLQHQRVGMQPMPLLPAGEQERIQLEVCALQRA